MRALAIRRNLGRKWWPSVLLWGGVVMLQTLLLVCATHARADEADSATSTAWSEEVQASQAQGGSSSVSVPVFQVKAEAGFDSARRYAGTLVAARTAELGFKRGGEVAQVDVDLGMQVMAGDRLALLDTRLLQADLQRASADVALAKANLVAAQADAQLAANTERRMRQLREKGHASQQNYDEVRLALRSRAAQVDVAKANLQRAQAARNAAQVAIDEASILAPFTGRIQARYADEGSQIGPGTPLLKLVESDLVEAHVGVPTSAAARLEPGRAYDVFIDGKTHSLPLRTVLPEVDPATRTVMAVFELAMLESADATPSLGSVVELEFSEQVAGNGFWVPLSALTAADRGLWSVFVVNDRNLVERRLLEVLHTQSDRVFVRGTLTEADRVVQTGVQRVVPGQSVIPVPALQASL